MKKYHRSRTGAYLYIESERDVKLLFCVMLFFAPGISMLVLNVNRLEYIFMIDILNLYISVFIKIFFH